MTVFLFLDHKGNLTLNSRFSLKVVHGCCPPSHKMWQVGIPPHCWSSCLRNDCLLKTCSLLWVCGSCRLVLVLQVCLNQAHLAYLFNETSFASLERHMAWGTFVLVSFVYPQFLPALFHGSVTTFMTFLSPSFISLEFAKAASRLSFCLGVLEGRFLQDQSELFYYFLWFDPYTCKYYSCLSKFSCLLFLIIAFPSTTNGDCLEKNCTRNLTERVWRHFNIFLRIYLFLDKRFF